jgi:zinc/manganese transport system substrate-binding protein
MRIKMKSDTKRIAALCVLLLAVNVLAACLGAPEKTGKPTVVATIFPYYDAVRFIGGDKVNAELLLDSSMEVHDYTASLADKAKIDSARLIVRNGLQLDDWQVFSGVKAKMCVIADGVDKSALGSTTHSHGDHTHSYANPHIWLDPLMQKRAAEMIRDALIEIDPINKQTYTENAAAYISQLDGLHLDFSRVMNAIPDSKKTFIGFHDAYYYLAVRYSMKQVETVEEADKSGLTPAQIEKVKAAIKEKKATVLFAEDDASRENIQKIVGNSGVTIGILLPLEHGAPSDTYVSLMKQNLDAIKKAMQ